MDETRAKRMAEELLGEAVGGWIVEGYVNHGKSAVVFKGGRDGQRVALKVFDPELIERFGKETQLARINRECSLINRPHEHTVRIFGGGQCPETNLCYVAMEFVDAPNLKQVIPALPRERIADIIRQLAGAARYLESLALAHRDIKPENIALSRDFAKVTLLDLGVIRPIGEPGLTDVGDSPFVGTHQYAPPEFLMRKEVDSIDGWRAVTFYQIGAVLHDLIMREPIFKKHLQPFAALSDAVRNLTPSIDASDVHPEIIGLARNCLVKDPSLRVELVNWESFNLKLAHPNDAGEVKNRLAARHKVYETSANTNLHSLAAEYDRQRTIEKLASSLEAIVRRETLISNVFPPVVCNAFVDPPKGVVELLLLFRPSETHNLRQALHVFLEMSILDKDSCVVDLGCAVVINPQELRREDLRSARSSRIFKGVFQEQLVSDIVGKILLNSLDAATEPARGDQAGPEWLSVERFI